MEWSWAWASAKKKPTSTIGWYIKIQHKHKLPVNIPSTHEGCHYLQWQGWVKRQKHQGQQLLHPTTLWAKGGALGVLISFFPIRSMDTIYRCEFHTNYNGFDETKNSVHKKSIYCLSDWVPSSCISVSKGPESMQLSTKLQPVKSFTLEWRSGWFHWIFGFWEGLHPLHKNDIKTWVSTQEYGLIQW